MIYVLAQLSVAALVRLELVVPNFSRFNEAQKVKKKKSVLNKKFRIIT